MDIKLSEQYTMTSDSLNYILNEVNITQSGKNAGQERVNAVGFFPTLGLLAHAWAHKELRAGKAQKLHDLELQVVQLAARFEAIDRTTMNLGG